jgi:hypothetical protein
MPSFKYANAHAGIFAKIHGQHKSFVATTTYHRIKSQIGHCSSFQGTPKNDVP